MAVYSEYTPFEGLPALFVVDLTRQIIRDIILASKFKTLRIYKQQSRIYLVDTNVASITSGQGFELKPRVNVRKLNNADLANSWVHKNTWRTN